MGEIKKEGEGERKRGREGEKIAAVIRRIKGRVYNYPEIMRTTARDVIEGA
jgi:hypothetical protein